MHLWEKRQQHWVEWDSPLTLRVIDYEYGAAKPSSPWLNDASEAIKFWYANEYNATTALSYHLAAAVIEKDTGQKTVKVKGLLCCKKRLKQSKQFWDDTYVARCGDRLGNRNPSEGHSSE